MFQFNKFLPHCFLLLLVVSSCVASDPIEIGETEQLITDEPINFLRHWHGPDGILSRFGDSSEVGALMQYDFKDRRKFVIIDGTGKQFIYDINGQLYGPHPVRDLFRLTDIWNTASNDTAQKLALILENEGVEAAVFAQLPSDNATSFTFSTKTGNLYNLYKSFSSGEWEILNIDYGITSHLSAAESFEAFFVIEDSVEGIDFYKHAFIIDNTGENIINGFHGALGTVSDYWNGLPSDNIEAACYLSDQKIYPTIIRILGEKNHVKNGCFVYVSTEVSPGEFEHRLSDLRKTY